MNKGLFTVYNSSAGSGKTTTLVKEYLRLCLPHPRSFNRVIGITFTNKATAEMKERILRDLQNLIDYNEATSDALTQEIVRFVHEKTGLQKEEIPLRAKELMERILHQYADFAFSTIDSFVMRIVRSFAYELNLALNFEIELDKEELISNALQAMMLSLSSDKDLKRILVQFTLNQLDDEKSWNIDGEIGKLAGLLFESGNFEHVQALSGIKIKDFEHAIGEIKKQVSSFEGRLTDLSSKILEDIKQNDLGKKDFSYGDFPTYLSYLQQLKYDKFVPGSRLSKNIANDVWYPKKASAHVQGTIDSCKDEWRALYQDILTLMDDELALVKALKLIHAKLYPLAVLTRLQQLIRQYSAENNIIHISESNRRIASIVEKESVPFIYERVGQRYDHYLVDEFQDTSRLQWNNLMPLVENALASGKFNMIVGDAKQSIYRWRDGDADQFVSLQNPAVHYAEGLHGERERYIKQHLQIEHLSANHRSGANITQFNNQFFSYYLEHSEATDHHKTVYTGHEQQIPAHRAKADSKIQIHFLSKEDEKEKKQFELVADKIADLIENGGYHPKDICILGRRHQELASYAEALNQRNIEVVSSEVASLSKSEKVQFVISFFRWIQNPLYQEALFHLLSYIHRKHPGIKQDLFSLTRPFGFGKYFHPAHATAEFEQLMLVHYQELRIADLQSISAYELWEILCAHFTLETQPDIFLQFLSDSILTRSRRAAGSIHDFLEWWDEKGYKEKVKIPEDLNAVRLFTVHAAKGLQFPVVFNCLYQSRGRAGSTYHWVDTPDSFQSLPKALVEAQKAYEGSLYQEVFDEEKSKQELDMLNLTYVAFTRPTEALFLTANPSHPYASLLSNFVQIQEGFEEKEAGVWEWGSLKEREKTAFESNSIEPQPAIHQRWQDRVKLHFQRDLLKVDEARKTGNIYHEILAHIAYPDDLDKALAHGLTHKLLSEEELPGVKKQLHKILESPELAPFFEEGNSVRNEKSLLYKQQILRPDRVIEKENEILILDYKHTDPDSISEKQWEDYRHQVQDYITAIQSLSSKQVRGYLAFIKDSPAVMEI